MIFWNFQKYYSLNSQFLGDPSGSPDPPKFGAPAYMLPYEPGILFFKIDFGVGFNSKYSSNSGGLFSEKVGLEKHAFSRVMLQWKRNGCVAVLWHFEFYILKC